MAFGAKVWLFGPKRDLLLGCGGWWHYTGQNYGIAMMFLHRSGVHVTPLLRRWIHASFVLSYLLTFAVMHRAAGEARRLDDGGSIRSTSIIARSTSTGSYSPMRSSTSG